jgi:glycosyltransferase involved in cell wall biosynthesis
MALLLSPTPESYGLTLDECWAAEVPVLALDHGAPAERIREMGGGVLVSPEIDASALRGEIQRFLECRCPGPPTPVTEADAGYSARKHLELYAALTSTT